MHGKVNATCYSCKKAKGMLSSPTMEEKAICTAITTQDIMKLASLSSFVVGRSNLPEAGHACVEEPTKIQKLAEATPAAAAPPFPLLPFQLSWLSAVFNNELENDKNEEQTAANVKNAQRCNAKTRKKTENTSPLLKIAEPTPIKKALAKQVVRKLPLAKRSSSTPKALDLDGKDCIQVVPVDTANSAPQSVKEDQQLPSGLTFTGRGDDHNLKMVQYLGVIAAVTTPANQKKNRAATKARSACPCNNKAAPPIQTVTDEFVEIELKVLKRQREAPKTQNSTGTIAAQNKTPIFCSVSDDDFEDLTLWKIDELPCKHMQVENDLEPCAIDETLDLHFIDHWQEFLDQKNESSASQEVLQKLCHLADV